MSVPTELDDETRARLRWEAERLAAEQNISLMAARQIVWADYLDELAAAATAPVPPVPEVAPAETAVPVPPAPVVTAGTHPVRGFWSASNEVPFTPEWLAANKARLAQVKRLVGIRSK